MLQFGRQHHSQLFELYLLLHSMFLCSSLFSSNINQFFFATSLFLSLKMKKTVIVYLLLYISFFKENVRYPVWTCRDPISLILGIR